MYYSTLVLPWPLSVLLVWPGSLMGFLTGRGLQASSNHYSLVSSFLFVSWRNNEKMRAHTVPGHWTKPMITPGRGGGVRRTYIYKKKRNRIFNFTATKKLKDVWSSQDIVVLGKNVQHSGCLLPTSKYACRKQLDREEMTKQQEQGSMWHSHF